MMTPTQKFPELLTLLQTTNVDVPAKLFSQMVWVTHWIQPRVRAQLQAKHPTCKEEIPPMTNEQAQQHHAQLTTEK
jgi:hypothetical protein